MHEVNNIKRIISDLDLLMIRDQEIPYDKIKSLISNIESLGFESVKSDRDVIEEFKQDSYMINDDSTAISDAMFNISCVIESSFNNKDILTGLLALNAITNDDVDTVKTNWALIKDHNSNIFNKSDI